MTKTDKGCGACKDSGGLPDDVTRVYRSRGSLIIDWGPVGEGIPYEDFLAGKMPE